MELSHLFSLMVGLGLAMVAAAFVCREQLRHQRFIDAVVRRFSGRIRQSEGGGRSEADSVALRRSEAPPFWIRLFGEGAGAAGLASLSAEMRRVALVLTLTLTSLVMLLTQTFLGLNIFLGAAAGLGFSALAWYLWASMRIRKRMLLIEEAVPEALDMIVRSLRVGLPVVTAIQAVGNELSGPLAEEFAEVSRRISYGQTPISALREMAERCQNQNLRFFAAAVALQSSTGGNLAEVLERLCAIARGRQQLQRKVRSITAEAKWSGRFLSAFPLLATMMLLAINPRYFDEISDKAFFIPMLCVVAGLLVLNMLFMRWLVKIE
ncbi:type II secretion system F family protein [Pseudogemmobacter faecipullorum]|uniref:Type II secretion system F family protein n=1 Tax=Pseudogemmobacter faecipullorum TaxID=2755041 RepID=A0ABS8CH52_9RHOB|nr:type II secretion system F family protein [Pseudogemmobacter faecipullorum]MCB5408726.1 type II secretion system F family protein [Pseudogemmobacter faecipullorum]